MVQVHEVCGMERLLSPLGSSEETLGVGRFQRYLKYKEAVKEGAGRDWDHGVKSGKEGRVTVGGWKPANEEGCCHRAEVGSRIWVPGGARIGEETWHTEASVVQGETPACREEPLLPGFPWSQNRRQGRWHPDGSSGSADSYCGASPVTSRPGMSLAQEAEKDLAGSTSEARELSME